MNADCTVYKTTVNCINCDQLLCLILVRLGQVSTLIGLLLITELGARQFFSIAKTTKRHVLSFLETRKNKTTSHNNFALKYGHIVATVVSCHECPALDY